uniref:Tubulin polyglutamylase TTLL6 n=1 Tax=Cacopsylla melanoneura TaxID=428564 RepID=A0A8D8UIQ4_9HEMI
MTSTRSDPEKRSSNERGSRETHHKILKHPSTRTKRSVRSRQYLSQNKIRQNMSIEEGQTETRQSQIVECENDKSNSTSAQQGTLSLSLKKGPVINLRRCMYKILDDIATEFGMIPVKDEDDSWDVHWADASVSSNLSRTMQVFQRTNHFPGMANLESKAFLAHHLNRMRNYFPDDYSFFPRSWSIPWQADDLYKHVKTNKEVYIFKPTRGAEGKGIKLFATEDEARRIIYQDSVVQVYVPNLLLMDGYKFDLRVYVLITMIDPLRIYVYNNGLVRLATYPYAPPNSSNLNNQFMHLTNYSINKNSENYKESPEHGSKRDFVVLNSWFLKEGLDSTKLWSDIDDVIIKTITSVYPILKDKYEELFPDHYNHNVSACFEMLGMDILIDDKMKPYLLEVNRSPSFNISGVIDERVKTPLLRDTFRLVNLGQNRRPFANNLDDQNKKTGSTNLDDDTQKNCDQNGNESDNYQTFGNNDHLDNNCIKEQIKWEQRNNGNYRLIYPSRDSYLYAKFIHHIFSIPEASGKRLGSK